MPSLPFGIEVISRANLSCSQTHLLLHFLPKFLQRGRDGFVAHVKDGVGKSAGSKTKVRRRILLVFLRHCVEYSSSEIESFTLLVLLTMTDSSRYLIHISREDSTKCGIITDLKGQRSHKINLILNREYQWSGEVARQCRQRTAFAGPRNSN